MRGRELVEGGGGGGVGGERCEGVRAGGVRSS